ncbi:MAG: hypothetical protein JWM47_1125 [Acidimicrobiales bacterium]|nr:hypothetical protein [Acidimicrobiales bacterium]
MTEDRPALTYENVLDPVSGARSDVAVPLSPDEPRSAIERIDGSALWSLPGLYDADQHWPVPDEGLRAGDRWRALWGGSLHVNTAYSWDRIAPSTATEVARRFDTLRFPQVFPVLSVPDEGSEPFARWVVANAAELRETWPPVCKLYSADPHFERNVEAVWEAGLTAIAYCYDDAAVDRLVATTGGPLHFRHATSEGLLRRMKARPNTTLQTSPHFLLALVPDQAAALHVLPPVPGEPDRTSLLSVLDEVEMIGTDHNAPVAGNDGPGLDVADTLLSALVTLAAEVEGGIAALLPKVTSGPAEVFGTAARLLPSRLLVEPSFSFVSSRRPDQEARRSPYLGLPLHGRLVAAITEDRALLY